MMKTAEERKLERIEDEVVGMTIEIVGTVWGISFHNPILDEDMKFFNTRVADIRDDTLRKIRKIYSRKTKRGKLLKGGAK